MTILYIDGEHCTSLEQLKMYFKADLSYGDSVFMDLLDSGRSGEISAWLREHGEGSLAKIIDSIDKSLGDGEFMKSLALAVTGDDMKIEKPDLRKFIIVEDAYRDICANGIIVQIEFRLVHIPTNESLNLKIRSGWGTHEITINTCDYEHDKRHSVKIEICKRPGIKLGEVILFVEDHEIMKIKSSINDTLSGILKSLEKNTSKEMVFTVKSVNFKMIKVDGGYFQMGAVYGKSSGYNNEKPDHRVWLNSYYIEETPVTQELWSAVMESNHSCFSGHNRPVENVSWYDCQRFIDKLNELTGRTFSLPTEAQWEYAARGGNKGKYKRYAGSEHISDVAWYHYNSGAKTNPVKMKKANELGIYDMCGNVDEWCYDWYNEYSSISQVNPKGPTYGTERVYRGGNWGGDSCDCSVTCRCSDPPSFKCNSIGFRIVLLK